MSMRLLITYYVNKINNDLILSNTNIQNLFELI